MADEHEIRRINWTETFSFTQIFKSFRLAMHFSKLALALAAILLVYLLGTVMDKLSFGSGRYVAPQEIGQHFALGNSGFDKWKSAWTKERPAKAADFLVAVRQEKYDLDAFQKNFVNNRQLRAVFQERLGKYKDEQEKNYRDKLGESAGKILEKTPDWSDVLGMAKTDFNAQIDKLEALLKDIAPAAAGQIDKLPDADRTKAREELKEAMGLLRTGVARTKIDYHQQVAAITGQSVFTALRQFELRCVGNALSAVRHGNFTDGLGMYRELALGQGIAPEAASASPAGDIPGMIYWTLMSLHGYSWLLTEHWIYGPIFLLAALAIWALFGGAIYRIAALHAAREEKISAMQALRFSFDKFLSFLTAPLLPMLLVLVLGALVMIGGALISIPVAHVVLSLFFFLILIAGLFIAFLTIGWFFGGPLMYPTIAVEGSDSFDAMSRSFSYVLNRPWRSVLYGLVAAVYGTVTYLFVRFFALLALSGARAFAKAGAWRGGETIGPWADQIDVLWSPPTFDNLMGSIHWEALGFFEKISAGVIGFYVFLLAGLVAAYLISYFASASTVIYLLLRRCVDATDTDDVYVEEADEELPAADMTASPGGMPAADTTGKSAPAGADATHGGGTAPPAAPPTSPGSTSPPA